jgi:hypothetical protein
MYPELAFRLKSYAELIRAARPQRRRPELQIQSTAASRGPCDAED